MTLTTFKPNYAIHPGRSVQETLAYLGMSQIDLAERTGLTKKHISEIIQEKSSITPETAIKLEFALSINASFWIGLQKHFDEIVARIQIEKQMEEHIAEASKYPYAEMAQYGWVEKTRDLSKKVENLLRFFGVNNFSSIKQLQGVAFRKSNVHTASQEALAAWLRKAEVEAQKVETQIFDRQKLIEILPLIREMTKKSPKEYVNELKDCLAACGIALVVFPHLKQTRANGATQWLNKDKVIIQLSLRFKDADIFWFSLFHEIGHILKHGKKETYVSFDHNTEIMEMEANEFASDSLIPKNAYKTLVDEGDLSATKIKEFANQIGVHAGIVVGRLQFDKKIAFNSNLKNLKEKYDWVKNQ